MPVPARAFVRSIVVLSMTIATGAFALPSPDTHVYKRVGDLAIHVDVHRPPATGPRPVVVYFHGGSLVNGRRQAVQRWAPAEALVQADVIVASVDYRLAPESKLPAIIADLEDALRWVRAEGPKLFSADPDRVAVAGSSAGGYLALVAGHRVQPRPRAILAEMSYGDLLAEWQMKPSVHPPHYADSNLGEREAWAQVPGPPVANADDRAGDGGAFNDFIRRTAQWPRAISGWDPRTEAERYHPYLPVRNVTPAYPPTFLLHGRADSDVPFSQPEQIAAEFARHGIEHRLVGIDGAEHGWRGADPARVAALQREGVEFLLEHLKPAGRIPSR